MYECHIFKHFLAKPIFCNAYNFHLEPTLFTMGILQRQSLTRLRLNFNGKVPPIRKKNQRQYVESLISVFKSVC